MSGRDVSVITVCMNRREHLRSTAAEVSRWPHHREHVIVDWSSRLPLRRGELPDDPRIRLVRVEGERHWHLCRAYNLAIALARGDCLLKLDADCWPLALPEPEALEEEGVVCAFGSGGEGRLGQWLVDRSLVAAVGGYNEYLEGYGFDDKDFRARISLVATVPPRNLPAAMIGVIVHSAILRADDRGGRGSGAPRRPPAVDLAHARAQKRATALANRVLAARCPWSPRRRRSLYRSLPAAEGAEVFRVEPASVPVPSLEVAEEARRLRRRVFWGLFLSLPEELVVHMPTRLLPADRRGRFTLRRWQRVCWFVLRPLWAWPLMALLALQELRSRAGGGETRAEAVPRALAEGDVEGALAALRALPSASVRQALAERLLFQRALRPADPEREAALLEGLGREPGLRPHQRAYARVALGWWAIRRGDRARAAALWPDLEAAGRELQRQTSGRRCGRRNRENRIKRLVSTWTVLAHLSLMLERLDPLPGVGEAAHDLLQRMDPGLLPAEVMLRMSSNLARCLALQGPAHGERLQADLARLHGVLLALGEDAGAPEEDHRGYVEALLEGVRTWRAGEPGAGDPAGPPAFAVAALNLDTPLVRRGLARYWG